ncbi:MAG TPA: ATP-binding protein [Solirubrobacteraceae bacterium]|nr:ATP-binding protein [Solirubrobacteraceae bacterium]
MSVGGESAAVVSPEQIASAGWQGRPFPLLLPPLPRRRLLGRAAMVAVVLVDAVLTVQLSKGSDWEPLALLGLLAVAAAISELGTIAVSELRVSSSILAVVLAMVLLGPAPAVAIATVTVGIESVVRGVRGSLLLLNFVNYATLPLLGGWLVERLIGADPAAAGELELVVVVLSTALVVSLLSFLVATLRWAPLSPRALGALLRDVFLPIEPYFLVGAALAAAAAHAYRTVDLAAMTAVLALLLASELLLRGVAVGHARAASIRELTAQRSRLLGEALTAEERERQRLAAYLHDEPLQLLLAARQDLHDAALGDAAALRNAEERLGAAIGDLRRTLAHVHPLPLEQIGLGPALQAVTRQLCHGRLEHHVSVDPELRARDEGLVYSVARELIGNAVKHSGAGRLDVALRAVEGGVCLEVSDDGVGFDPGEPAATGHVGLALAALRVRVAGGELAVDSGAGVGSRVRATLPLD